MAWIRCPVAGARKLAQTGKVILGWSIAKVIAIPRRPLQCFSAWNWDTYGLRACPPWTEDTCVTGAAKSDIVPEVVLPRHPSALCASHSGLPPTTGWVGWHVPPPPKTKRKRPVHEPAAAAKTQGSTAEAAVDGREEAMELAQ